MQRLKSKVTTRRDFTAQFQRERLHRAAEDGGIDLVEDLLKRKCPVNRFDTLGKTPLHYAVRGEHFAVVDRLIEAGANVNAHDERQIGNTPLADNAANCSYEMARRLIDAGADPTIPGWMMLTALDRAERRKRPDGKAVLKLLREAAKRLRRS